MSLRKSKSSVSNVKTEGALSNNFKEGWDNHCWEYNEEAKEDVCYKIVEPVF